MITISYKLLETMSIEETIDILLPYQDHLHFDADLQAVVIT
ncbi:hypothetical protein CCP3SC1AL1_2430001 [Gammaproteobacteria bacterium]